MLRFLTAGESHGPALVAIVDGLPAGLSLAPETVDAELRRRQHGYGRGARMLIEQDRVEVLSGVRHGRTLGSPIALLIRNHDWVNWQKAMAIEPVELSEAESMRVTRPRPGHADLAGALKYDVDDARDVLERASARETTARVAVGAVCRRFLREFGIEIASHTTSLGPVAYPQGTEKLWREIVAAEGSPLRCADPDLERKMIRTIDRARKAGDSTGGSFQVVARGVPLGLGSHRQWNQRLGARLTAALGSIQSVKAVSVGSGVESASAQGSKFHDEIFYDSKRKRFRRGSNNAGGIEGGISNGEEIRLRAYVKPLSTLPRALRSVDLKTKKGFKAQVERTDVTAIAAAGVVGEAMTAIVLCEVFLEKFGGDSIKEITRNHRAYLKQLRDY